MRIAVIADVHWNAAALDAVFSALQESSPDLTVSLGDLVLGPFDPAASARKQMAAGYITIAGNHERQLLEGSSDSLDALARPLLSENDLH